MHLTKLRQEGTFNSMEVCISETHAIQWTVDILRSAETSNAPLSWSVSSREWIGDRNSIPASRVRVVGFGFGGWGVITSIHAVHKYTALHHTQVHKFIDSWHSCAAQWGRGIYSVKCILYIPMIGVNCNNKRRKIKPWNTNHGFHFPWHWKSTSWPTLAKDWTENNLPQMCEIQCCSVILIQRIWSSFWLFYVADNDQRRK